MTNIAHEQQTAALHDDGFTAGAFVDAIRVELACNDLVAFDEFFFERALHQTKPVAIHGEFVAGIHCCNGIFTVLDRGHRGFHIDILDACVMLLADHVGRIELDFQVQAMVCKQHGSWCGETALEADQFVGIGEARRSAVFEFRLDDDMAVLVDEPVFSYLAMTAAF